MQNNKFRSIKSKIIHLFILPAFMLIAAGAFAQGPEKLYLGGIYNHNEDIKTPDENTPQFVTTDRITYTLEIDITGGANPSYEVTSLRLLDGDGNHYGPSQTISDTEYIMTNGYGGGVSVTPGYKYKFTVSYTQYPNQWNSSQMDNVLKLTVKNMGSLSGGGGDIVDDGTHKSIKLDYTYNTLPDRKLAITPDTEITFDGRYMYVENSTGRYMNSLNNLGGFSISSDPGTPLSDITTGINTPITDTLHVLNTGSAVEVTGASAGTEIFLFNIDGMTVAHATQGNTDDATALATGTLAPGIYILTVGNKSFKLAIR